MNKRVNQTTFNVTTLGFHTSTSSSRYTCIQFLNEHCRWVLPNTLEILLCSMTKIFLDDNGWMF